MADETLFFSLEKTLQTWGESKINFLLKNNTDN